VNANPILGTGIFLLGGVAAALYLLPFRGVKGWAYETGWLVSVIAGWVAFPIAFDLVVIPDLWGVLGAASGLALVRSFGFGVLWGIGALCWALMVRYLGVGLGLGIGAGLCAAAGTLLPPICTGHGADLVATPAARMVLGGIGIALVGIVAVGLAGRLKEGEMSAAAKKKAVAEFNFKKGLVMAVIAGLASACVNFGLQGAPELEKAALAAGASPTWAGMPVLTVVLWGGVLTQVMWVGWKRVERWKGGKVERWKGGRVERLESGKVERCEDSTKHSTLPPFHSSTLLPFHSSTILINLFLSSLVGVAGASQYVLQKAGEPLMGDFRYISFAVLMSSAVFFSAFVGIMLGEWKGVSGRTRVMLTVGELVLTAGFVIVALAGR